MKPVRVSACLTALVLAASGLTVGMAPPGGAATTGGAGSGFAASGILGNLIDPGELIV